MKEKYAMDVKGLMKVLQTYNGRKIFVRKGYEDPIPPIELSNTYYYDYPKNEIGLNTVVEYFGLDYTSPVSTDVLYNLIKGDEFVDDGTIITINGKRIIGSETFMSRPLYLYLIIEEDTDIKSEEE